MRQFFVTFLAVIAGLLVVKFLSPIKNLVLSAVSAVKSVHAAKQEKNNENERSDV